MTGLKIKPRSSKTKLHVIATPFPKPTKPFGRTYSQPSTEPLLIPARLRKPEPTWTNLKWKETSLMSTLPSLRTFSKEPKFLEPKSGPSKSSTMDSEKVYFRQY